MLHLKQLKISEWVCNLSENVFMGVLNQSSIYCNQRTHHMAIGRNPELHIDLWLFFSSAVFVFAPLNDVYGKISQDDFKISF